MKNQNITAANINMMYNEGASLMAFIMNILAIAIVMAGLVLLAIVIAKQSEGAGITASFIELLGFAYIMTEIQNPAMSKELADALGIKQQK